MSQLVVGPLLALVFFRGGFSSMFSIALGNHQLVTLLFVVSVIIVGVVSFKERYVLDPAVLGLALFACSAAFSNLFQQHLHLSQMAALRATDTLIYVLVLFLLVQHEESEEARLNFNTLGASVVLCTAVLCALSLTYYHFDLQRLPASFAARLQDFFGGGNRMLLGKLIFVAGCFCFYFFRRENQVADIVIKISLLLLIGLLSSLVHVTTAIFASVLFVFFWCFSRKYVKSTVLFVAMMLMVFFTVNVLIVFGLWENQGVQDLYFKLDDAVGSRLTSGMAVFLMFGAVDLSISEQLFGLGVIDGRLQFQEFYAAYLKDTKPTIDLSNFLQSEEGYSPHNAFSDALLTQGLLGSIFLLGTILLVLTHHFNAVLNSEDYLLRFLFCVQFSIVIGFFCSDNDFVGGSISFGMFWLCYVLSKWRVDKEARFQRLDFLKIDRVR